MKKRIGWVDTAKGMTILLVIIGHLIGDIENPINMFILSFHMPFFFFISGFNSNAERVWGGISMVRLGLFLCHKYF